MGLTHHELCFGCGIANLFGLQIELEPAGEGTVVGRFFLKQDHQGPPGQGHGGVIAAALDEAMALAVQADGASAVTGRLDVEFNAPAPAGAFVEVEARIEQREEGRLLVSAVARQAEEDGGALIAEGRGVFVESP